MKQFFNQFIDNTLFLGTIAFVGFMLAYATVWIFTFLGFIGVGAICVFLALVFSESKEEFKE